MFLFGVILRVDPIGSMPFYMYKKVRKANFNVDSIALFSRRIEVIRKPTGPDGTRGFTYKRTLRSLSDTSSDHTQGCPVNGSSDTPTKLNSGTSVEEGNVFEDLVAKICDQE